MKRLCSLIITDIKVQIRNKLYAVGIGVSLVLAVGLSQLADPVKLYAVVPALILVVIGATTMLYVAGLIIFEKDEGTLNATIVSPVTTTEYLSSKVITLTSLATLETIIMVGGAFFIMSFSSAITLPSFSILLFGVITIAVLYTLIGIILVVRFNKITDYLMPMALVISVLQLPFIHFWGVVEHIGFLILPTSAPTMLMQGAFTNLTTWQWIYGLGYSSSLILVLAFWTSRAFNTHVVNRVG
jgi:fluoroquinolone transport system permease protein